MYFLIHRTKELQKNKKKGTTNRMMLQNIKIERRKRRIMVIVTHKNMKLNYELSGEQNSTQNTVIWLIHGAAGHLNHFDRITSYLIRQRFHVLTCDIRYHGSSQPINDDPITFQFKDVLDDLDFIISLVKQTHYPDHNISVFLGGLSMGGIISLLYAVRHENKCQLKDQGIELKGIIPIGSAVPSIPFPRTEWKVYQDLTPNLELTGLMKANIVQSAEFASSQEEIQRSMKQISNVAFYKCLAAIADILLSSNQEDQSIPPTMLPMLLIIPGKDAYTRKEMESLHELNTLHGVASQAVIIENALHMVVLDYSSQVAAYISEFCKLH